MHRIPFSEVHETLTSIFIRYGFTPDRAQECGLLFAEATRDGVYSHGVARLTRFLAMIKNGGVDPGATPALVSGFGAMERWDGRLGPGNLNAWAAMERAIALSKLHGIGSVALRNTNHWMRGGTYGWQAAEAGCIGICWTNTLPNLPAWGATNPVLGNNPMVFGVPRTKGSVVLDMAMSQFSYGALSSYSARGETLPVPGGFDADGNLTQDPGAIERSQRSLPIGYWKGSGLALMLDLIVSVTALGKATHQLSSDPLLESGISQFFLALRPEVLGETDELERVTENIVASLRVANPVPGGASIRYPGERTLQIREENLKLGLPVDPVLWQEMKSILQNS